MAPFATRAPPSPTLATRKTSSPSFRSVERRSGSVGSPVSAMRSSARPDAKSCVTTSALYSRSSSSVTRTSEAPMTT